MKSEERTERKRIQMFSLTLHMIACVKSKDLQKNLLKVINQFNNVTGSIYKINASILATNNWKSNF